MRSKATLLRRLVPALLLASLTLASCQCRKEQDPRPRCGNTTTSGTTKPGGNS